MARAPLASPPRLLLVAEAATFAHVARMTVLRRALDGPFHVQAAFDPRYDEHLDVEDREHLPLYTIPSSMFIEAVNRGRFPYHKTDLTRYVTEDLRLLSATRPDLVVGDFRLSLAISCRLAGIRYLPLVNGYWTPECQERAAAPRIRPLTYLPEALGRAVFSLLGPLGLRLAARTFNHVARDWGVDRGATRDLRDVYAQADRVLTAEPEGWLRMATDSDRFVPIGAIGWASRRPLPEWWGAWAPGSTVVYVSLGSSGDHSQVERVCEVLGARERTVVVVTGKDAPPRKVGRATVYSSRFVNSRLALEQAHLFVSNGGSLSLVDALRVGCPVVGIASNYDQILSMAPVVRHGVGALAYEDTPTRELAETCHSWLSRSPERTKALRRAQALFSPGLAEERLVQTVRGALAA